MSPASLGVAFVVIGLVAMFLMYHLWGYPFDKAQRKSAAPRWAMWLHRLLGYAFVLLYVGLMWRMVPRLWEYQVEFPARTTAHIILGFAVGFLLLIKIAIMRFFRHFEEWMPMLGTSIVLCTVILTGLSLPFVFQERALAQSAPGGSVTAPASLARVATLLTTAGLPTEAPLAQLATAGALRSGRHVLLDNCVKCHDLRTILAKPRSPSSWWTTVERMADKPALFAPMTTAEMFEVTAYLIAITPDLQRASKQRRDQELARDGAIEAVAEETVVPSTPELPPLTGSASPVPIDRAKPSLDLTKARRTYESVCSQCHELSEIDEAPPKTPGQVRAMITRMIRDNDAELSKEEVKLVTAWLEAHFVKNSD